MQTNDIKSLTWSTSVAPGAQPWFLPGGPVGVLIIHGYGGSIGDYRQFGELLNAHGCTVMGLRLAGHGESLEVLRATGWRDWQDSVRRAAFELRRQCNSIIVVGSSFGGALALNYARNFPAGTDGVVAVNPAVKYRSGGRWQTFALRLLRLVTPDYRKPGLSAAQVEQYRQLGSMTHWPIDGIFETYAYINTMVLPQLPKLTVPTLIMAMADDPTVHPDSAKIVHEQTGAAKKKLVWLPGKTHRPFRDAALVETMVKEILNFFQ